MNLTFWKAGTGYPAGRATHDHIVPAGTVRRGGIAKMHNIFARQQAAQLAHGGQPAKAAVKYADGTSIHR